MKKQILTIISLILLLGLFIGNTSMNASAVNDLIDVGDEFSWDITASQINVSLYPGFSISSNEKIKITVLVKGSAEIQVQSELKNAESVHNFGATDYFEEVFENKHFYLYGMLILPLNIPVYQPIDSYLANEGFAVENVGKNLHVNYSYHFLEYDSKGVLRSYEFNSPAGSYSIKYVTHNAIIIPVTIIGGIGVLIGGFFLTKVLSVKSKDYRIKREKRKKAITFLSENEYDRKAIVDFIEPSPTSESTSIPLSLSTLTNQSVVNIFFTAFAVAIFYFFVNIESFLITRPIIDLLFGPYWFGSHRDQVDHKMLFWGVERIDMNIGGYITASLLILAGYLWIVKVNVNKEKRKVLKITISSFIIAAGALLIVSSILQGIAYEIALIEDITAEVERLLNITYWMETSLFILLFIILILISVELGKSEYKCLVHNAVWMIIGFAFLIVGSVFAILAMEYFFSDVLIYNFTLVPREYLPKLLPGTIFPALGKIIITVSFIFALIKFQKRKMSRLFVGGFQTLGVIYVLALFTQESLLFLYNFLYPTTVLDYPEEYIIYAKKIMNLEVVTTINQALFWILLLAGLFAVAKAIVFDNIQVEYELVPRVEYELDPNIPVIPMASLGEVPEQVEEKKSPEKKEKKKPEKKEIKKKPVKKDDKRVMKTKEREKKLAEREKEKEKRQTEKEKKKGEKQAKTIFCTICGAKISRNKTQCKKCGALFENEKTDKKTSSKSTKKEDKK